MLSGNHFADWLFKVAETGSLGPVGPIEPPTTAPKRRRGKTPGPTASEGLTAPSVAAPVAPVAPPAPATPAVPAKPARAPRAPRPAAPAAPAAPIAPPAAAPVVPAATATPPRPRTRTAPGPLTKMMGSVGKGLDTFIDAGSKGLSMGERGYNAGVRSAVRSGGGTASQLFSGVARGLERGVGAFHRAGGTGMALRGVGILGAGYGLYRMARGAPNQNTQGMP